VATSASVVEILVFFWMAIFEANRLLAFGIDLPAVASCLVSQDLAIVVVPLSLLRRESRPVCALHSDWVHRGTAHRRSYCGMAPHASLVPGQGSSSGGFLTIPVALLLSRSSVVGLQLINVSLERGDPTREEGPESLALPSSTPST